ncbi:MAG: hypothetical protein AAFZ07_15845 [Actinomycetota bacterium]
MTKMRTKAAGAGMAVLLGMGGAVAVATSSGAQDSSTTTPAPAEAPPVDGVEEHDGCDWLDEDLTEEELAELQTELQAEADAMVAALDAAGVQYELIPDEELGVSFPEPVGDDPADWEAFEAALLELWADEFAALPADEQAEIVAMESAFAEEFRTALDEAGIAYELETDPVTGVEFPMFDEDDEAAWEALDELDLFDDELFDEDDDLEDGDEDLDDGDEDGDDEEPEQAEAA